jgi:hypothetical protein
MARTGSKDSAQATAAQPSTAKQRRALLKKLGRFAAVSAPTVTLLLTAKVRPGVAASCIPVKSSRVFKTRIAPVDGAAVLAAVAALPIRLRRG